MDLENVLLEFDRARKTGQHGDLAQWLGKVQAADQMELLAELVKIDVEYAWKENQPKTIHDYLQEFPALDQVELRELLIAEFEARVIVDKLPSEDELSSRFSKQSDQLDVARQLLADHSKLKDTTKKTTGRSHVPPSSTATVIESGESTGASDTVDESLSGQQSIAANTRIGHYIVEKEIGEGAFATVWKARDTHLKRDVAIKVLKPDRQKDKSARERFIREARAAARLDHPNVVRIHEVLQLDNRTLIVSSFIDGPTLEALASSRTLTAEESIGIVRQIALGLHTAHLNGVIHRDIKPANILMKGERPMIADFGMAHVEMQNEATMTKHGDIVGTPTYMAPEQARGDIRQISPRTDVYSVGAILYRLLTGQMPFQGSMASVIHEVINVPPTPPRRLDERIDKDLETIALKCLEKDPFDRYESALEMAEDLERVASHKPILARRASAPEKFWKWTQRHPRLAAWMGITLLLVGFGLGTAVQLRSVMLQRDRAQKAEQETEGLLAQASFDAGSMAMQRGRMSEALRHFEDSLERGYPDQISLYLKLVETSLAARQYDAAFRHLQSAQQQDLTATNQGIVQLWKAELSQVGYAEQLGDPIPLYEAGLVADLGEDETAYVNGMLANNSLEAIANFADAIQANPFHHRARRMVTIMLFSLARFDETLQEIEIAKQLFPEDLDFRLLECLAKSAVGDVDDAIQIIDELQLKAADATTWKLLCEEVEYVTHEMTHDERSGSFQVAVLSEMAQRFNNEYRPVIAKRNWHFPPKIGTLFVDLPDRIASLPSMSDADSYDFLKPFTDAHPEGSLLTLLGGIQLRQLTERSQDLQGALDTFLSSLEHPAFVADSRVVSLKGVFGIAITKALVEQKDVARNTELFVDAARQLNPNDVQAGHFRGFSIGLINVNELELATEWTEAWIENAATDPQKIDALWHRGMIYQRHEEWLGVWRMADQILQIDPEHSGAEGLRDNAAKQIEQLQSSSGDESSEDTSTGDASTGDG